jgi:uncharacterized protein YlxW (UPF0749 family)
MKVFCKKHCPFLLAGFVIGALIVMQLRSDTAYVGSHPLDEYELQQELVASFQADQAELEEQLSLLSVEVEAAQAAAISAASEADNLTSLKQQLGLTEVSGQGVVIQLDDKIDVSRQDPSIDINEIINAADLRDTINVLRQFPYEALAINDQRIVYTSPITSAGNNILVNNFQISAPFEVKILTTVPESVIQKLTDEGTLTNLSSRIETSEIIFKFKKEELLTAPAYIGGYRTNYLTTHDE